MHRSNKLVWFESELLWRWKKWRKYTYISLPTSRIFFISVSRTFCLQLISITIVSIYQVSIDVVSFSMKSSILSSFHFIQLDVADTIFAWAKYSTAKRLNNPFPRVYSCLARMNHFKIQFCCKIKWLIHRFAVDVLDKYNFQMKPIAFFWKKNTSKRLFTLLVVDLVP